MNYEDEEGLVLQTGLRGSRDSVQFVTLNHCTEQGNCETATNVKWLNLTWMIGHHIETNCPVRKDPHTDESPCMLSQSVAILIPTSWVSPCQRRSDVEEPSCSFCGHRFLVFFGQFLACLTQLGLDTFTKDLAMAIGSCHPWLQACSCRLGWDPQWQLLG